MFKSQLTAIRPKEQLTLKDDSQEYVSDKIAQYLLPHQINGVRFLYQNYKKQKSSILNDEGGSGKCFQCIALFDVILKISKPRILVISQQKTSLEHWQYHINCLLNNIVARISDNETDTQGDRTSEDVLIASLDHVLNHLETFIRNEYDCIIFQDQQQQTSINDFAQLTQIKSTCKVILCSNDLMENLVYFYEVLKFCDQKGPITKGSQMLNFDEFKLKFGCNDKSISKRNMLFRQRNLLNSCIDFYLRRLCNQCGSQFPPIKADDFRVDFEAWKSRMSDTMPVDANATQNYDSSHIELLPSPNNQTVTSMDNEVSILNVACTDFSDFDTQMSPLIYSDSDNNDDELYKIQDSPHTDSQCIMTPEIACNQEHAANTRAQAKEITPTHSKSHVTPIKRNLRSKQERKSPACKRLNYKQLPIKVKSNARSSLRSKTYLFRKKKHPQTNSTILFGGDSECLIDSNRSSRQRSTSSTSDIQIVSQNNLSPIVISTSEDERTEAPKFDATETQFNSEISCPSPDLFTSFTSTKSDAVIKNEPSSQNEPQIKPEEKETDTFREIFGAPDECDDIDLLSNTNVDIFEITKNSVFDNVLCSADDKITPVRKSNNKSAADKGTPSMTSLSGLRVRLPRLNHNHVEKTQIELMAQPESKTQLSPVLSTSTDVIDITENDSQNIIEINSSDSVKDKTPERKLELTPSTRSCLKRHSDDGKTTEEKRKKSPYSRLGWLSTARTSPQCGTPQSHRKLEKWHKRTDEGNLNANEIVKLSRPRNLFMEFKSKENQKSRDDIPSTSTALSPTIFSDHE